MRHIDIHAVKVTLAKDKRYYVTCRDVPELTAFGDTEVEALGLARTKLQKIADAAYNEVDQTTTLTPTSPIEDGEVWLSI